MKFNKNIAGYLLVIKVMLIPNACFLFKDKPRTASGKGKNFQANGPASSIPNQTTASGKGKNFQANGPASSIPNQTTASGKGKNVQANGPASSIPNQTTASGKGKNFQDLQEELFKKYYLSEKEMIQKVNEIKKYEVSSQKEYYINLFKGENDPACQKLEKAYANAKASINSQMENFVKYYGMDRDYIDRIMQDKEVLIKLRVSSNKFSTPWQLCCLVNQKDILPYHIRQISNKETIAGRTDDNMEKEYLSYIRDQIRKKISVDQVMPFNRWRKAKSLI